MIEIERYNTLINMLDLNPFELSTHYEYILFSAILKSKRIQKKQFMNNILIIC